TFISLIMFDYPPFFIFDASVPSVIYTLSLHDALPIWFTNYNYSYFISYLRLFWTIDAGRFSASWFKFTTNYSNDVFYNGRYIGNTITSIIDLCFFIFTFWRFSCSNRCWDLF